MIRGAAIQWPTLAMLVVCYLGIGLVTLGASGLAEATGHAAVVWVAVPVLSVFFALHSSLQHELLHGNPFRKQWLNDAFGFPAVGFFVPYERFKTTHLAHHIDENLTDPHDDPESQYMDPIVWQRLSDWLRRVYRINNTLAGRMIIGPVIGMLSFYRADIIAMLHGDRDIVRAYLLHLAGIVIAAVWFIGVAQWSIAAWLLASYGALSILRIRTYLEHRANESVLARTAIVDDRHFLGWLFLFNNLHAVHHKHSRLPWYELPGYYEKHKTHFNNLNGHYFYSNYLQVFRQYFVRPKDPVPHPLQAKLRESLSHVDT